MATIERVTSVMRYTRKSGEKEEEAEEVETEIGRKEDVFSVLGDETDVEEA